MRGALSGHGSSNNTSAVQGDWANRDFMQSVQLGVAQLTSFLTEFGTTQPSIPLPTNGSRMVLRARRCNDTLQAVQTGRQTRQIRTANGGCGGHITIRRPGNMTMWVGSLNAVRECSQLSRQSCRCVKLVLTYIIRLSQQVAFAWPCVPVHGCVSLHLKQGVAGSDALVWHEQLRSTMSLSNSLIGLIVIQYL